MDLRKIKKLIELLEASDLVELEVKEGEAAIRLTRASYQSGAAIPAPIALEHLHPAGPGAPPPEIATDETPVPSGHVIKSPMVGTYYGSASPDGPPFTEIGKEVSAGDTLCIIEAMKIFNQIESDRSGKVRAIFKESGDPVEYGEVLFVVD